jgi:lysozyme family protein
MRSNFDRSFDKVIGHEGGFTDDRRDRGNWTKGRIGEGELRGTKYGISAMSYPNLDIRNLSLAQAKEIYLNDFWVRAACDELPVGLDYLVFDMAVNHGIAGAGRIVQQALNVKADGVLGPVSLRAIKAADPHRLIREVSVRRMLFYIDILTFKTFGLGWTRRCFDTAIDAYTMAGKPTPTPAPVVDGSKAEGFWSRLARLIT